MTGAFTSNTTSCEEQVNIDAPLFHIVPYVTGGYQRLLRMIKTDSVPDLAEYGYHTNSEGHFDPKGECVIGLRYKVKRIIDTKGQSAVLVLAQDEFSHTSVVIKVLHSHFYQLGGQESHVLRKLAIADPLNCSQTLRLLTTVAFDSHYCLVFDPLLPQSLTSVFSDIPAYRILTDLKRVGLRLLASVGFLHQQNLIHTDLKPDNILLKYENDLDSVHIVDFGNTIHYVHSEVSLYYKDFELQTPLYRSPEVMFGVPFGPEIDVWSMGCVLAELFLGKPLFFGTTKEEIMEQITSLLGPFPSKIFRRGKFYKAHRKYTSDENQTSCTLKLLEHLKCKDVDFADLIAQMLKYDPEERLTVSGASRHPFFASYLPLAFLLPRSSGNSSCQALSLSKAVYSHSPYISADLRRQPLSSLDLLRQGTAEVPHLEDTTIVKPSPRMGIYAESNCCQSKKIDAQCSAKQAIDARCSAKQADKQSNKNMQSDMSVVRNFIVGEDKQSFSKNVKDKMSALLEVIREEQDCVEDDLERRNDLTKSNSANENLFSGTMPSELVGASIQRPCPRYGRFRVKGDYGSEEKQRMFKSNECSNIVGEIVSFSTSTKHPKTESSRSNQNFQTELKDKTVQSGRRRSREVDTRPLYKSEDFEVKDGSPTLRGIKDRKYIQQPMSHVESSSSVDKKVASVGKTDINNMSLCSSNSDKGVVDQDMAYISGSEYERLHCSDYRTNSESESSHVEIMYSSKSGNDKVYSIIEVKDMDKLKEQVGLKRLKSRSQIKKGRNLRQQGKEVHSSTDFSAYTEYALAGLTIKHPSKKGDAEMASTDSCKINNSSSRIPPLSCNKTGCHSEKRSPGSSNRKRLASDRISDDEEYLELLSPMATGSNKKKKVKPEKPARHTLERTDGNQVTYEYEFNSIGCPELESYPKETERDTDVHRTNPYHPFSIPRQKYDRHGIQRRFLSEKNESKQSLSRKVDLIPSANWCHADRRRFIEKETLPSVTPIKKEKNIFPVDELEFNSPEIFYKTGNKVKQKSSGLQRIEDEKVIDKCHKSLEFSKSSLSSGDKNRLLSHKSFNRKSLRKKAGSEFDQLRHVNSSSLDQAHQELPVKVQDYIFRGTPDTDLKQLASKGGYAERIAYISKKRKKARKSLAFDSRQSATKGNAEQYDKSVNCSDASSEDGDDNVLENNRDCQTEYRLLNKTSSPQLKTEYRPLYKTSSPQLETEYQPLYKTSSQQLKHASINQMLSKEIEITHRRKKYMQADRMKVQNQHRRPVLRTEETIGVKFQKALKQKKLDSTFTIEFESPFRDKK